MAFGQYILEMEVLVTEAFRNNIEPSPCPSGQTAIEILQLKLYCSDKTNNMEQSEVGKAQLEARSATSAIA